MTCHIIRPSTHKEKNNDTRTFPICLGKVSLTKANYKYAT